MNTFELQPLTPVASSSTDITRVSTPAKDEIPKSPSKPTTPVKLQSPVKLSARKETAKKVLLQDQEEPLKFHLSSKNKAGAEVNLCVGAEVNLCAGAEVKN